MDRRQPPICHDRHERDLTALLAQYGGAVWPLDDDLNTVAKTGVVRELSGAYPGAVSGVTLYNQLQVTGGINPAVNGTYNYGGYSAGYPYYVRSDGAFFINVLTATSSFYISTNLNSPSLSWYRPISSGIIGTYTPFGASTGLAVVSAVIESGTFFIPAGVTFSQPGPVLGGRLQGAAGFDGAAGRVTRAAVGNPANGLTIMGWVNCTNPAQVAQQVVVSNTVNAANRFSVVFAQGALRSTYWNGATAYSSSIAATTGWHHFVAAKAAGNTAASIYFDGVQGDGTLPATIDATADTLWIGARPNSTLFYAGSMAFISIIPAALTSNDIYALYAGAIGG